MINNELVCHTGIIQFPLKKGKKRVHRLVVLPDYQGIGIGTHFINEVAKMVTARGYEVNLTTTTPALVGALRKSNDWLLARYGRATDGNKGWQRYKNNNLSHLTNTRSSDRITYSFWFREKTTKLNEEIR